MKAPRSGSKKRVNKKHLVLGVGNILLRDEGLGVRTVEYLLERFSFPEGVDVVDGGTAGLKLLPLITGYDHIIIVDAVASRSAPGAVYRIPGSDIPKYPPLMTTAHQIGVREVLSMAAFEGATPEVVVIGMEPSDVSPGLELSPIIGEKIPAVAGMVLKELRRFGIKVDELRCMRCP